MLSLRQSFRESPSSILSYVFSFCFFCANYKHVFLFFRFSKTFVKKNCNYNYICHGFLAQHGIGGGARHNTIKKKETQEANMFAVFLLCVLRDTFVLDTCDGLCAHG